MGTALPYHPGRKTRDRGFRVGVVGFGAGTLAACANASIETARPGGYVQVERRNSPDTMRFYELNPMVVQWAEEKFTFLPDARRRGAIIDTLLGDARIVMERQLREGDPQRFDVLVIDAFSGDAIPIHLLTRESFDLYWSNLAEDGILAVHVPNRYLDVKPVIHRLAQEFRVELIYSEDWTVETYAADASTWILLTKNQDFLSDPRVHRFQRTPPDVGPLWTDDYSSIFSLIKFR